MKQIWNLKSADVEVAKLSILGWNCVKRTCDKSHWCGPVLEPNLLSVLLSPGSQNDPEGQKVEITSFVCVKGGVQSTVLKVFQPLEAVIVIYILELYYTVPENLETPQ